MAIASICAILRSSTAAAGGRVVGIIPQALLSLEVAHRHLSELHIVHSMHERKAEMARRADAFLILPGGWGTLDELCEALTWAQLGIHRKACGLWNLDGYYDLLLRFLDHAVAADFLPAEDRDLLLVSKDLEKLLAQMATFTPGTKSLPYKLQDR